MYKLIQILSVRGRDYVANINQIKTKLDEWIENLDKNSEYIDKEIKELRNETLSFNDHIVKSNNHINDVLANLIGKKFDR